MGKPVVFISHIHAEAEVAIAFKELVETSFLGMLEVFVSSDGSSIPMGQKWLESITAALKTCVVEVIIASPHSVVRPWVNFEAGAAWVRDVPVIPLCHSGMKPSSLPVPLSLLQAGSATDEAQLRLLFPVLAKALNCNLPQVDFEPFVRKVRAFEERYTFWNECNHAFAILKSLHADLLPAIVGQLATGKVKTATIDLTDQQIRKVEPVVDFLLQHELIRFHRTGGTTIANGGPFYQCQLEALDRLAPTVIDQRFTP